MHTHKHTNTSTYKYTHTHAHNLTHTQLIFSHVLLLTFILNFLFYFAKELRGRRDSIWTYFRHLPSPCCDILWHCPIPPTSETWQVSFYKSKAFSRHFVVTFSSKVDQKCHVIFWLTPSCSMCHLVTLSRPPFPWPQRNLGSVTRLKGYFSGVSVSSLFVELHTVCLITHIWGCQDVVVDDLDYVFQIVVNLCYFKDIVSCCCCSW